MITCRVEVQPFSLADYDVGEASERVGQAMRDHWQSEALRGRRSNGRPLPRNKKGLPLGIGHGTIIRTWQLRRLQASRVFGATACEPYQGGRYAIAVRVLMRRGIVYHTLKGSAAKAWKATVKRELAELIRVMAGGQ